MLKWNEATRAEVARILEMIAQEAFPGPRDLDVALDAIFCTVEADPDVLLMNRSDTNVES